MPPSTRPTPFSRLRLTPLALVAVAALSSPSAAAECGAAPPDYAAQRSVSVAGGTTRLTVLASGDRTREEVTTGAGRNVTIRGPQGAVTFDPVRKEGARLPPPPKNPRSTRVVEEAAPGGGKVRRLQFERDGTWIDLSTTTCRPDGIMTRQTFVAVDQQGREVQGVVTQTSVKVGPVDAALFQVPPGITIRTQ